MKELLKQGYDVLSQKFFVKEKILDGQDYIVETKFFDSFEPFYRYRHREIYKKSFYFQCPIDVITKSGLPVDLDRMKHYKYVHTETIDDSKLTIDDLRKDITENSIANSVNALIEEIQSASTLSDLCLLHDKWEHAVDSDILNQLITYYWSDKISASDDYMTILIQYLSQYDYNLTAMAGLFFHHDYKSIVKIYRDCDMSRVSESTRKGYCGRLNKFAKALLAKDNRLQYHTRKAYDATLGLYYVTTFIELPVFASYGSSGKTTIYFHDFESFESYLNNDLTDCDLSFAPGHVGSTSDITLNIDKRIFRSKYSDSLCFEVTQQLKKSDGTVLKEKKHSFEYFYEFLEFVKYDLSGMDLSEIFELTHLLSIKNLNISNCKLPIDFCKKFNIELPSDYCELTYNAVSLFEENDDCFNYPVVNDNIHVFYCNASYDNSDFGQTQILLDEHRNSQGHRVDDIISYVSDIHLEHRLQNNCCKTDTEIRMCIKDVAKQVLSTYGNVIVIAGDVCSNFNLYQLFIEYLVNLQQDGYRSRTIIFTLGNHELWGFSDVDKAVTTYKELLNSHGMYLLHNNMLLFKSPSYILQHNGYDIVDITLNDNANLFDLTKDCHYIMFGGIGFAGCSETFNANNGIYREALSREQEIEESAYFKKLYNDILPVLKRNNSVVVTHMPKKDWSGDDYLEPGIVYVSGHTHQNRFYDDGDTRLYADNQVGYKCKSFAMKAFWLNNQFDVFDSYSDGVYDISVDDYSLFLTGHGISSSTGRLQSSSELKMLKRGGYYMFVCRLKSGKLAILNGGSSKTLLVNDVNWYYDHIPVLISASSKPLNKYTEAQQQIAKFIQSWGGVGSIHGCIIDIDFCNHVYLNPFDGTTTCYWAENVVNKVIYPSIQMLLEQRNPLLLSRYMNYISTNKQSMSLVPVNEGILTPKQYLDTDIYKASRELNKMQKLYDNIITFWPDNLDSAHLLN